MTDNAPPIFFVECPTHFAYVAQHLHLCEDCVAVTESLSESLVFGAYQYGLFPWFKHEDHFYWFSPAERTVLAPEHLRITRSLKKRLLAAANGRYNDQRCEIYIDRDTDAVIDACAKTPRKDQTDTWITPEYLAVYGALANLGVVHSVSVYIDGELSGGLWGTCFGRLFVGESMFHLKTDASKIALATLCALAKDLDVELIDCQAHTDHLQSLGATTMQRPVFTQMAHHLYSQDPGNWASFAARPLNQYLLTR